MRKKKFLAGVGWVIDNKKDENSYDAYINDSWAFLISVFRWYPDVFLDIIRSEDAKYPLELIQRVMLRVFARYQFVTITGCRGLTKTTCVMLWQLIQGVLWSHINTAYFGPSYRQQAGLARNAFSEIEEAYPILTRHYRIQTETFDQWRVYTRHGSYISVDVSRGRNLTDVTAEEFAQEDGNSQFDFNAYTTIVLYAVRLTHLIKGKKDPTYIPYKQRAITSAGRRQNHAYETRENQLRAMRRGKNAFVMDVPWEVVILSQMRPYEWALQRREESTVDKWMREMESHYTGADENPLIRDEVLNEARSLLVMEEHHCCKDRDCKLKPEDVIYIVGYDVSYEDSRINAKCAVVVVKCTKQKDWMKRDKYLKEVVYVDDWKPVAAMEQARKLKSVWYRFCFEGSETYIVIDGWQYGKSVIEALMMDLGDGLLPLCIYNHMDYVPMELENSLPIIYPIKAGGAGVRDPDSEMVMNAETQFENRNVRLLTGKRLDGIDAYKKYHRIKDDSMDGYIDTPYRKTTELVGQIQNLKRVPSGAGVGEKRISQHIQRDSWSALKYALRFAQKLERINLVRQKKKSDWDELLKQFDTDDILQGDNRVVRRSEADGARRAGLRWTGGKRF